MALLVTGLRDPSASLRTGFCGIAGGLTLRQVQDERMERRRATGRSPLRDYCGGRGGARPFDGLMMSGLGWGFGANLKWSEGRVLGGCGEKKNVYNVVIASERRSHTGLAAKIED